MIFHCTKALAAKLPEVSSTPLADTNPLGSWHAHLHVIDRRQCIMFCHDTTRFVLFESGLKKEQFQNLGKFHKQLYLAALIAMGCRKQPSSGLNLPWVLLDSTQKLTAQSWAL